MFQILAGAFVVGFLLLGLDAVGILAIPAFIEKVLYGVAGGSILAGALIFGPRFMTYLFGR